MEPVAAKPDDGTHKIVSLHNIDIIDDKKVILTINPKIFGIDVVQSAAYVYMNRAYCIMDGDPDKKILVELTPLKEGYDLEQLGRDFNNELLNYGVYKIQSARTKNLREKIVQRALFTNLGEEASSVLQDEPQAPAQAPAGEAVGAFAHTNPAEQEDIALPEIDESAIDDFDGDPADIMTPWEDNKEEKKE